MTTLTATVPVAAAATPATGTHVPTKTSIVWNWNAVAGAVGYKWSTANDFVSSIEMGIETSKGETGLSCGVPYLRYVWAYNECGFSTPVTLTQTTLGCWICGDPFLISHAAGSVAPVSKMVAYTTASNIPGEPAKCWITQNLGASQPATVVSDATEASAGWYWQFNRKQGYKHDGTTRTPNTAWITTINENSNWATVNDPCAIELGSGWRIPTKTELDNVTVSGGWTNWNGPWNSALKMHAAGHLYASTGTLITRGSLGTYASSTQSSNSFVWYLNFSSTGLYVGSDYLKVDGLTVRCLRDY